MSVNLIVIPLNGEYFDLIKKGDKTEEYRLTTKYWKKRLVNRNYREIVFTRGYPKIEDQEKRLSFKYDGYEIKTITHKHFGADPVEVFAIQFSKKTQYSRII